MVSFVDERGFRKVFANNIDIFLHLENEIDHILLFFSFSFFWSGVLDILGFSC